MARIYIALVYVAVLLRGYYGATVGLDAIDFMHTDDKGQEQEKCKSLPEGITYCSCILSRSRDIL